MKINDILTEAGDDSGDYQQMQAFVRANRVGGVPADQQVALALFKELKKQRAQNTELGRELSAAEKRIDQAVSSGELSKKELGMHQAELDRERGEIEKQQQKMGQIDQQYADRAQASERELEALTNQLEQLKSKPGVDKSTAQSLQNQIEKLQKEGIGQDRYQELQQNVEQIQKLQQVDDSVIRDLIAQVKDAQQASKELQTTRATVGKDAEATAQRALDQVEQIKKQLAHFQSIEAETAALGLQVNKLAKRQDVEDQLRTANAAKDEITQQAAGSMISQAEPSPQMSLPGVEAPASGGQLELPGVDQAQSAQARAKNIAGQIKQANPADVAAVYENQLRNAIAWAVGKRS